MATTEAPTPTMPTFQAPGPGTWQFDSAHFTRPVTPWMAEAWSDSFSRGFGETFARHGVLLQTLELVCVHGWPFMRPVPAAEDGLPARFEAARASLEGRLWREDLARWDAEVKPDSVRRNRALLAVDVAGLDDAGLAAHLEACHANHAEMCYRHHMFNMAAMMPVGMFVAEAAGWTGESPGRLLDLLRGSTPVSAGIAAAELSEARAALRRAGVGPWSFEPGADPGTVLEGLRARTDEVGEAVRAYLDACGLRVATGYDVADLTSPEMPSLHLEAFWAEEIDHADDLPGRLAAVRARVPAAHRDAFDALLAEARHVNRLRDERGLYNDLWAAGIARRAILEAGRRLALRGRLDQADLVFEATAAEMASLLRGGDGPSAPALRARRDARLGIPVEQVPLFLGDPPAPPPSLDGLPEPTRRVMAAVGVVIQEILGHSEEAHGPATLRGKGVSSGAYEGTARVVGGPQDFSRVREGDVLVTNNTNAAFNVVLPLLGAIVTNRGALLSHAAIVAREYGIPAVVGTREGTARIPDGARVRVDGTRGTVEVLR